MIGSTEKEKQYDQDTEIYGLSPVKEIEPALNFE